MRLPGFEPGLEAWEAPVLPGQTIAARDSDFEIKKLAYKYYVLLIIFVHPCGNLKLKIQNPKFKIQKTNNSYCLEFGYWNFDIIWLLVLEIWNLKLNNINHYDYIITQT